MTDDTTNLVLSMLRAMRDDITKLGTRMDNLTAEVRISNQHIAALMQSDLHKGGLIADLAVRVERIEKRLELVD